MDIAAISMALSQMNVQSQVDISMMKKTMNTAEQQGNALMEMLQAPHPTAGRNIDIKL
ncbi:YjfB family protein [Bacillus solimangrovi]|uniref:YjfB family protein n=1 Tax=Bacillus solimangrovi TaxID=1305675 RepID=UPI0009F3EC4F|nr:YjfB family protein [Bacillus solimangrovi]